MTIKNRVTTLAGNQYSIIQAPMGWIARSQLASAVSARQVIDDTITGFHDTIKGLSQRYTR